MNFYERKRRQPPAVIIVPLIDILMVLLVFMMATSTFKMQPAIRLTLPESREGRQGASQDDSLVITIANEAPYFYLGREAIELDPLEATLRQRADEDPDTVVSIRADTDAPWGKVVGAMDAVKKAGFKRPIAAFTRLPAP